MRFNFGDQPFKFPPEEGYDYTALTKAKGLIDGEGTYVLQVCGYQPSDCASIIVCKQLLHVISVRHTHTHTHTHTAPLSNTARPSKPGSPRALILEPARELAQQTSDNIRKFSKHLSAPPIRWVWSNVYLLKSCLTSHDLLELTEVTGTRLENSGIQ